MQGHSALNGKGVLASTTTWYNLKDIVMRELSWCSKTTIPDTMKSNSQRQKEWWVPGLGEQGMGSLGAVSVWKVLEIDDSCG